MDILDHDFELLTLDRAADEARIPRQYLRRYVRARPLTQHLEVEPQYRTSWHEDLLIEPVFRVYTTFNVCDRADRDIAERASALFYILANLAYTRGLVGIVKKPKDRLIGIRKRLASLRSTDGEYPDWRKKDAIFDRLPPGSIPEFVEAWEHVRPDLLKFSGDQPASRQISVSDTIQAIDVALARMNRRGPKPNRYKQEATTTFGDHYFWLTGRKPSILNWDGGSNCEFANFQRAIYPLAGIPAPSDDLIRGRAKKRN